VLEGRQDVQTVAAEKYSDYGLSGIENLLSLNHLQLQGADNTLNYLGVEFKKSDWTNSSVCPVWRAAVNESLRVSTD
jgi:hypothetical protein